MSNVAQIDRLHKALHEAAALATVKFPHDAARIERGLALALGDAVIDHTNCTAHTYTVRSATEPGTIYTVVSNGQTTCTCPDGQRGICTHGYAVLLVRKARVLLSQALIAGRKLHRRATQANTTPRQRARFIAEAIAQRRDAGRDWQWTDFGLGDDQPMQNLVSLALTLL